MCGEKREIECRSDYAAVIVLNSSSLNSEDAGYMRGQSARRGAAEVLVHSEVRGQSRGHAAPGLTKQAQFLRMRQTIHPCHRNNKRRVSKAPLPWIKSQVQQTTQNYRENNQVFRCLHKSSNCLPRYMLSGGSIKLYLQSIAWNLYLA